MKKFFGKIGKKSSTGRPTPPPSPNLNPLGATGGVNIGYDVREKDLPKLHKAVWNEDLGKVKSLVKKDVNGLDKELRTPLHLACVKGNKPILQELLEWHAKPNHGDSEGKTPLLKAVECKREDCVMLLLQHTADVDTRDRQGDTAVHVAVKNSYTSILRLLIKSGADINIKNKSNFAPLHLAVKNKKDEVTKILLQSKADFDVMDGDGRTPLMYACYEGAITQVKDLISVGADTQIKDMKGFTAGDVANQKGQHACSHLLDEHNNKQSGSVASTPRMPSISSRTPTPRQEEPVFGLPATNITHDDDSDEDGTFSRSAGDDSWKSDADMSLSLHGKEDTDEELEMPEEAPLSKPNLAKALNRIATGDQDDNEDKENESESHDIPPKRLSAKSIQSVMSDEIEWSDEDERSPVNTPRKSSQSKVSFIDKDVSEIHEITATESETDDGGEYQGSEAKRPKYDNTIQQQSRGYMPTGLTGVTNEGLNQDRMRVDNDYADDFMKDMGLEDDDIEDNTSTPDISELSDVHLPSDNAPPPPGGAQSKPTDSDWDSTEQGVTPRPSILKTSKQNEDERQNQQQQQNRQQKPPTPRSDEDVHLHQQQQTEQVQQKPSTPRSDEDTSEWDSEVEDIVNPQKGDDKNAEIEECTGNGKNRIEIQQDGSLRGIGDSPIKIRGSFEESTEDEVEETPVSPENEAPKGRIEESEDEKLTMIVDSEQREDADDENWDSSSGGFETEEEQTEVHVDKQVVIDDDGSMKGIGLSPINLPEDEEVDSEVADVFKAEEGICKSIKDDIKLSVKEIIPSPGGLSGSQEEDQSPGTVEQKLQAEQEVVRTQNEDVDEMQDFVEQRSVSGDIGGHSESANSNWDSSNEAVTPRGPPSRITTSAIVVGIDEDEFDDEEEESIEEYRPDVQEIHEPVQEVHETVQEVHETVQEVAEQTVDALNQTGGSHFSYVTTESQSQQNTVIQTVEDENEDEDSEWDSEEEEEIDCIDNVSPAFGVSPIVRGSETPGEDGDEEEEEEESVSEWELERMKKKEVEQNLKEEEERRREAEIERQREEQRLAEQREWEEIQRREQLQREQEEEALRQQLEEEEAMTQQMEREQIESEQISKTASYKEEETSSPKRIYKASVSLSKGQQKEETSKQVITDTVQSQENLMSFSAPPVTSYPTAPVVEETVTSFTASSVQSHPTAPVIEDTIQKEEKTRSYTAGQGQKDDKTKSHTVGSGQMESKNSYAAGSGQMEEEITSFSTQQTQQTTNANKKDVEKFVDPVGNKEQKNRPMSLESIDITGDDDDESVDMDHVGDPDRQDMGSYLRSLPASYSAYKYNGIFDDDIISLTSTEVDDSMAYQSNTPYGKEVLANMNLNDPGTVLKLQEHMHEQNKRLDHERNSRMTSENKYKSLMKEKNELQKKADSLNKQRSNLEQEKLELETRIRNLDYKLSEESEMRKNAETLLSKTKEQLNKKEEQYTSEIEAKQAAELQMRNLQMELRSANNTVKQLEEEKDELQQQFHHEKNARQMQEQFNEEQHRLREQLQYKQAEIAAKQNEAESQLEVADEDRKHAHDSLSILKAELTALTNELEKERKRRRDEANMMSSESEELQGRIEELKNENKMTEDALTKASMTNSLQVSNLNTEITLLTSQYEKERASKEKVDSELESVKTRLQSSSWEVDKAEQARSEVERRLQYEKEEWTKQLENSQKDNTLLKDQQQTLLHRLSNIEAKLNTVENELHVANTSLLERTNQLQQCQKDLEFYKSAQDNYDQNYKLEKELNTKLQTKVEGLQEKITGFQHENLTLKQQLETLQQMLNDRSGEDAHEKFTNMLASLKSENEKKPPKLKARLNLEERNSSLSEQVSRLKDENRNLESRRGNIEQENQRLNREYTDMFKKLSVAEASHEVGSKAKEQVDADRHKLSMDLEKSQQKYETAQQKCLELQTRVSELIERAERAENKSDKAAVQLMNSSHNNDERYKIRQDMEETLHHLQIDNARMDAELKHERQRVEQLVKDLQDSQKVRSSLEALCSNLKSSNNVLEDKREHDGSDNSMDDEVATRALLTQEAEDHKDLWEKEVVSRSKLGLRVSQYERQRQEALANLEEERRRSRKASENVKVMEAKLESEQEKNVTLQTELATMKGYLKMAKKKLRVLDTSDSRVNTITTEFDKERLNMESTLSEARQQVDSLQRTLDNEVDEKEKLHAKNIHLQTKVTSLKHLEKNIDKLEKNKFKLEEEFKLYKARIETTYVNKDEMNQKEKELEAHYRLQLNRKLDEINNYLEQQGRARERLDNSRDESQHKMKETKRKLEDENTSLKIQYEQVKAQKDSKEMEAKRFRDLYESEMQWRMRLSEQLLRSTDKAYGYKSKLVSERQRNRIQNNLSFSTPVNGNAMDYSRISMNGDDMLSNRLRAELDRSIAKHLEAAPHDTVQPVIRPHDDSIMNSSFAKSSAEYLELLKRKYCV